MTEKQPNKLTLHYALIGAILLLVIGAWYLWPNKEPEKKQQVLVPTIEQPTVAVEPEAIVPAPLEAVEAPTATAPLPQPKLKPKPEQPLDVSDTTVKEKLLELTDNDNLSALLVEQDLLQRFAVYVKNLANQQIANNHQLLKAPKQPFATYKQGGKEWIDAASFKRFNKYATALETMPTDPLLKLFKAYKPAVSEYFAEIALPEEDFDRQLLTAIDHLLDTPEAPMPIEVYTDSVMFKYRNPALEKLSAPQKQLLRTGPQNMRKIKTKLREIQAELDGSE